MKEFGKVAVGGTFDEFHKGHKSLLFKAFEVGEKVSVGLCSDDFAKRLSKPHLTATYEERLRVLKEFLKNHKIFNQAEIIPIDNAYGTTLQDLKVEALIVSEETERVAVKINEKRKKADLPPLEIRTITMVPSENCTPISTTRIKKGEMDHEGHILKS